jgi:Ca2+-binding RTX toxin-like protein
VSVRAADTERSTRPTVVQPGADFWANVGVRANNRAHGTDAYPRIVVLAALSAALFTPGTASAATPECTIRGTDRSDTLTGTRGPDVICGKGGNDRLGGMGGDGHDVLEGGAGNDDLQGEKGRDIAGGGPGNDTLAGGAGHNGLAGGDGEDVLDGGDYADVLDGGSGEDTVLGGGGVDVLSGAGGKDKLDGGSGADFFLGGADADVVNAKDERRDVAIDCGAGGDALSADAKDPKARNCELAPGRLHRARSRPPRSPATSARWPQAPPRPRSSA